MKLLSIGVLMSITVGCSVSQNDTGTETTSTNSPATSQAGRLSIQGKQIFGPNGAEIKLRGWNWGQWNTVLAGDLASQGYPNADPNDPSDGGDAAQQGANVVRILLRWWGEYGDGKDRFGLPVDSRDESVAGHVRLDSLTLLDDEITEATSHGLWVDLAVDSNCGQESPTDLDPYCTDTVNTNNGAPIVHANFVNDPVMRGEFKAIWAHLVDKYKNHDHIAMYEIMPEPQFGCNVGPACDYDAVNAFYTELIGTIRGKDTNTPILIGPGGGYSMKNIGKALDPGVTNPNKLIYTGNMLSEGALSLDGLPFLIGFRDSKTVPVFVQQVGIDQSKVLDMNGNLDSATYLMKVKNVLGTLDMDDIGWTWWTYRDQSSSGQGYAPWYLAKGNDTWKAAVAPNMLGTISAFFTNF